MAWNGIKEEYTVSVSIAADTLPIAEVNDMANIKLPDIFSTPKAVKDLQEYLGDFLDDVKSNLNIRLHPYRDYAAVHLNMYIGGSYPMEDRGFSFYLPFSILYEWDVPHFGDFVFSMWNAYVMALIDKDDLTTVVELRDPQPVEGEVTVEGDHGQLYIEKKRERMEDEE